ncbi:formimidoylglutamase [Oceanimonas doudoroffii]|uniref:Formimidoylglutamase n=2 Tax=Oceanimonas doudoroffii TaxID=84158 RepID=A0A233RB94_9GAMM|nr:formimidoylglutamase [Oceanimonas doudoroffii]
MSIDMSNWSGRIDPETNSPRWHQRVQPLTEGAAPGTALVGFCSDEGVRRNKGRTGAAGGPAALRRALGPLAWHQSAPAYDAGDVVCQGEDLDGAHRALAERVAHSLAAGHFPIVMGGGHEVAFGSWSGLAKHLEKTEQCPRIGIINFDAHFDLRDPQFVVSSGTPFAQIANACEQRDWPFAYACLGVSRAANTQALFARAERLGVLVREDKAMTAAALPALIEALNGFMANCDHLYLTVDIDVFPAAQAPGVSAPAPRGVGLEVIEPLIEHIRASGKLRLADLAELNPEYDVDGHTARLAARLIHTLAP